MIISGCPWVFHCHSGSAAQASHLQNRLLGMFSLNWRINPPGIVPSSCTCIVDTIFTGKLQSDVVCQVLQNISIFSSISFTCRCVRVFRQQSILFGTFLLTCQQLLTAPPSPWTSAWTGSLRLNIWAQCPRSGWYFRMSTPGSRAARVFSMKAFIDWVSSMKSRCNKCNSHQESTKQLTMQKLPVVASFHLKRWQILGSLIHSISILFSSSGLSIRRGCTRK